MQLVSATKGWGIQGLLRRIDEERMPTDDVYLVGATNVGKSALVNQIVSQQRTGSDKRQYCIICSPAPGTVRIDNNDTAEERDLLDPIIYILR